MNSPHPTTRRRTAPLILVVALVVLAAIACTPAQAQLLEGVLQNADAVNGQITILTKDGKTVTLTIATKAPIQTEGATSALETLTAGVQVKVEVDETGHVAKSVKARQAKIEGTITQIEGTKVTVKTEGGLSRTVQVTDSTRIELQEDIRGTVADLKVGQAVEIKYDPDTLAALKIDTEEESAEIEGVIVAVEGNQVTIDTEKGRRLSVVIDTHTQIELGEHLPGTKADLSAGGKVAVKFDPSTLRALEIEVEKEDEGDKK